MRTVHIAGEEVEVIGSPWALFLYNREFDANWHDDYEKAYANVKPISVEDIDDTAAFVKFVESLDSMFLMKTLWACLQSTDATTPKFSQWARSVELSMAPFSAWKMEVHMLIVADLFRN